MASSRRLEAISGLQDQEENVMKKRLVAAICATVTLAGFGGSAAAADDTPQHRNDSKFIGIDLDNGTAYYNGRNTGNYCIYRTEPVYNPYTGYFEYHRVRRCGRGLYF
jgi:hypothetical protein